MRRRGGNVQLSLSRLYIWLQRRFASAHGMTLLASEEVGPASFQSPLWHAIKIDLSILLPYDGTIIQLVQAQPTDPKLVP